MGLGGYVQNHARWLGGLGFNVLGEEGFYVLSFFIGEPVLRTLMGGEELPAGAEDKGGGQVGVGEGGEVSLLRHFEQWQMFDPGLVVEFLHVMPGGLAGFIPHDW